MYILKSSNGEILLQKKKLIYILLSHLRGSSGSVFCQYRYAARGVTVDYKVYRDDQLIIDFKEGVCHNLHMDVLNVCVKYEAFRDAKGKLKDAIYEAGWQVIRNADSTFERVDSGDTSEGLVKGLKSAVSLLRDEMGRVTDNCI